MKLRTRGYSQYPTMDTAGGFPQSLDRSSCRADMFFGAHFEETLQLCDVTHQESREPDG